MYDSGCICEVQVVLHPFVVSDKNNLIKNIISALSITTSAISSALKRVRFDSVFRIQPNGTITPLTKVQIGGITMGPGVAFSQGASFGGVKIAKYAGHDLRIEEREDGLVLKGIYR
jgi:uncharacterized membrane-anchored protein YitT (DUF2179 family)